jgi:hypothetical protein
MFDLTCTQQISFPGVGLNFENSKDEGHLSYIFRTFWLECVADSTSHYMKAL